MSNQERIELLEAYKLKERFILDDWEDRELEMPIPEIVQLMRLEVLKFANSTQYGLASVLWTQDITRANRMAMDLHTGIVWINCWLLRDLRTPFGGVKSSGVGREGGFEALDFFTEPKNVCVKLK